MRSGRSPARRRRTATRARAGGGGCWGHVGFDPGSRSAVSLVVGRRTAAATHQVVRDSRRRTGGRVMRLITSDGYPVYPDAIRAADGPVATPPPAGRRGRPREPYTVVPPGVTYATVHQVRENNRVVDVSTRVVFGTPAAVALALLASAVSWAVNTCLVERHNGTDRNRCSRKGYTFPNDWDTHRAATAFSYTFCWPVETLRQKDADGRWRRRTPAMAAGLTHHVWPLAEWLAFPAVQR